MQIKGSTVLITGANRGIGAEFVRQLKARGAGKIYATARNTDSIQLPDGVDGVEVLELDITNDDQIKTVAAQAADVDLLINNAGVSSGADLLDGDLEVIRREFEINFFGAVKMTGPSLRFLEPTVAVQCSTYCQLPRGSTLPEQLPTRHRKPRRGA